MKQKKNYLDFVPKKNPAFCWELDDDGMVVILIENRGIYNRIAQKLLKKPRVSRITLEKFGSFIWRQIDGTRSVYEISGLVSEEFGEEAEPLICLLYTSRCV